MAEETEGAQAASTEAAPATTSTGGSTSSGTTTTIDAGQSATQTTNTSTPYEIPAEWRGKFGDGMKTIDDVYKKFSASSSEARRQAQEAQEYKRKVEMYEIAQKAQPKAPEQDQTPFFGFKDREHYLAELERDPVGTRLKENRWLMEKNADYIEKRAEEIAAKKIAPFQQQSLAQREKNLHDQAVAKYPEIAEGGPLRSVVESWVEENQAAWQALKEAAHSSNINPWQIAADAALAGIHRGQAEALRAGQKTTQAKATTATQGAGVKGVKEVSDISALAQEARKNGEEVPDHVEKAMELAFNRPKRTERRKP